MLRGGSRHESERELRTRGDHAARPVRVCEQLERGAPPVGDVPLANLHVTLLRDHGVRCHRVVEALQTRSPCALPLRSSEQADPLMPVLDEMLHEQRDPELVVERHRAVAGVLDDAVEEDRRCLARNRALEEGARHSCARDEEAVDLVREQRLDRGQLTLDILIRVHEHHAVARLLETALRSLQRGCVERARHIRDDEADREGLLCAERAGECRRLEVQDGRCILDCGSRCRGEPCVSVEGAGGGRSRDAGPLRNIGERGLASGGGRGRRRLLQLAGRQA